MAKENPWFKFEPAEWKLGRIQRQSPVVKSVFLDIVCQYWHNKCKMTLEDARLDFGDENIDILLKNKMIKKDEGDNISISFLDEQMDGIKETSKNASKAGLISAAKRKAKAEQANNDTSTTVAQPLNPSSTEETRKDDTKGEETIKDKIIFNFKNSLLSYGFEEQLVVDWLKVRKSKNATNSETAYKAFIKVIELCNTVDKDIILAKCVEKSWAGVEKEWLINAGVIKKKVITNPPF